MIFLTKQDFESKIGADIVAQLCYSALHTVEEILREGEAEAIGTVSDYLDSIYDIDAELKKETTKRHRVLVRYLVDIGTYYLYNRVPDKEVPPRVIKNYNDTLADLVDLSKRKRNSNLQVKIYDQDNPKPSVGTSIFRMGGNKPRSH